MNEKFLELVEKKPIMAVIAFLILGGAGGSGIGAAAIKGQNDSRYEVLSIKVQGLEKDQDRLYKMLEKMDNKLDRIVER